MSDITRKVVIEYIQSIISSYETANIRDNQDSNYRMVWLSPKDVDALKVAKDSVRKIEKIEKLIEHWNDNNSFDTVLGISEVLENGNDD